MPKLRRGRLGDEGQMHSLTLGELQDLVVSLQKKLVDPHNTDDPRWLQRWIERLQILISQKEQSLRRRDSRK